MSQDTVEVKKSRLEKLETQVEQLQKRASTKTEKTEKTTSEAKNITRREFLKKAGLGTAGLAALGLAPASALNIKSEDFTVSTGPDSDSLTEYFGIDNSSVNVKNTEFQIQDGNLNMNGNEAESFVLENRSSDPSSPEIGQIWYRTDLE